MSKVAKTAVCLSVRNGVEIWMEADRAETLISALHGPNSNQQFFFFEGQMINRADIVGIFSAETMGAVTRRKNGQWVCQYGTWHEKKSTCECAAAQAKKCSVCGEEPKSGHRYGADGIECLNHDV